MRATRNAVLRQTNQNSKFTSLAIEAIATVGSEWRAFTKLSFVWRLWWVLTGHIHVARQVIEPEPIAADEDDLIEEIPTVEAMYP